MSAPLLALAAAAFGIGTTEFVIMGLLPEVAADLGVSIPAAGLLVTGYAAGVVIGAPLMAVATNGLARKATLIALMAIFVIGNLLCAVAPGYEFLMGARIFTAFAHAAFFGIAAVVAADLVAPGHRASAVALVFAGLTVANIMGVPAGTALGQAFGWRATFLVVAGIGVAAVVAMAVFLPARLSMPRTNLATEFRVVLRPQVLLAMSITVFTSAAVFTVFTFIAPILTDVTGVPSERVAWVLVVFGVGMTIGSFVGGRLADRNVMGAILGSGAILSLVLLALTVAMQSPLLMILTVFAWGLVAFSLAAPLQIRVVNMAACAPNVASTLNQAAFNLGNASGATLGAFALASGFALSSLPVLGFGLAVAALAAGVASVAIERRTNVGASAAA
jgi:DHA1 family inner membrane transport protein